MADLHFVPLTEYEQQIADETKLAKLIDAAESRGAAARQAEIVAWLRAQAEGYHAKAKKEGRGWSDFGRLIDRLADQIEGAK